MSHEAGGVLRPHWRCLNMDMRPFHLLEGKGWKILATFFPHAVPSRRTMDRKFKPTDFPIIASIARDYGSAQGTSVPLERQFSIAGILHTDIRQSMTAETLRRSVLIQQNQSRLPDWTNLVGTIA